MKHHVGCKSKTVRDIFEDFTVDEKSAVYRMVGYALDHGKVDFDILGDSIRGIYYGFTEERKKVVDILIAEVLDNERNS